MAEASLGGLLAHIGLDIAPLTAGVAAAKGELASLDGVTTTRAASIRHALEVAFFAAGAAAVAFGVISVREAIEGEQAQALLANAIRNTGHSFEEFAVPIEEAVRHFEDFGLSSTDVMAGLTRLTLATNDPRRAIDLLSLAVDIAAARHISLETAATMLGRVVNGNVGVLTRYGVSAKDAAGDTLTVDAAVLRLAERFGGAAQANADTFAGRLRALQATFENLADRVGQMLIPVLETLLDTLSNGVKFLEDHRAAAIALGVAAGTVVTAGFLSWAASATAAAAATLAAVAPVAAIVVAIAAIPVALVLAYQKIQLFHDAIDALARLLQQGFQVALREVTQFINTSVIPTFNDFVAFVQRISPQVEEAFTHIANVVKLVLAFMVNNIRDQINQIKAIWAVFGDDILRIMQLVWGAIRGVVETGVRVVRDVIVFWLAVINGEWGKAWNALKDLIAAAIGLWGTLVGNGFKILGIVFQAGWEAILRAAAGALDLLVGFLRGLPGRFVSVFSGAASWLYNAGIDIISGLLNGIIAAFDLLPGIVQRFLGIDALIQGIRNAVDQLNGARVDIVATADTVQAQAALDALGTTLTALGRRVQPGDIPGGSGWYVPPIVPQAKGGLIVRPTVGLMAEKGPELNLPLGDPQRASALLAQHGQGIMGGGSQSSVTNYYLNGDIVANDPAELERALAARARLTAMKGAAA